ncbi:MAG TPA: ABC transporter permease, partial [Gemmatimonadaceae bacterium]
MIRANIRRLFHLALRRRDRWEREVEDEIKLHLTLRAEQLMAAGASPTEAYDEAVRRFGPLTESRARMFDAARHREQRMQRTEYFADLRQDLAFALRTLRRQKAWTAVTLITLALGVGATTAVFSVVSSLLLHAVPYPGANRIVQVFQQPSEGNQTGVSVTITPAAPVLRAWKSSRSFEALEGLGFAEMEMRTTGEPASLNVTMMEPTFPTFAGERTILGRVFTASEVASSVHVAVLGEGVWRTRFGGDSGVVGRTIVLNDSAYSIVGVLPERLQVPPGIAPPTDVWLPIDLRNDKLGTRVVGRLKRGVSFEHVAAELDSLYARSAGFSGGRIPFTAVLRTPAQHVQFHDSLIMLTYAVALVLLIACANVAHLLMARAASRHRELAIRTALGAGRGRVMRQLLTESLLLAISGTALGVIVGWLGLKALVALRPSSLATLERAHLDGTTLGIAVVVALVTGTIFGLLGMLQSRRQSTNESLKSGTTSAAGRRARARMLLVVSEMALSATLVVGASMLVRSVSKLQRADLGFQPKGLYALTLPDVKKKRGATARAELLRAVASRLVSLPEFRSVALASTPPGWMSFSVGRLEIDGKTSPTAGTTFTGVNEIGTGYFEAMGIRLVQGTTFTDTTPGANQVIINARFARKTWGTTSPVGHRIRVAQKAESPWLTIVGVADDAATSGPASGPMGESSAPMLYTPATDASAVALVIRTTG